MVTKKSPKKVERSPNMRNIITAIIIVAAFAVLYFFVISPGLGGHAASSTKTAYEFFEEVTDGEVDTKGSAGPFETPAFLNYIFWIGVIIVAAVIVVWLLISRRSKTGRTLKEEDAYYREAQRLNTKL